MAAIDLRDVLRTSTSVPYGDLVTRSTGYAVRTHVESLLADHEDHVVVIDFGSVRLLDLSCADEIVAKLLLAHGRARRFLFRGVSEGHREAIEPVLERHDLAAVAQDPDGGLHILGAITDDVRRVFALLVERGRAQPHEIALSLEVPPAAADELCRELVARQLVSTGPTGLEVFSAV